MTNGKGRGFNTHRRHVVRRSHKRLGKAGVVVEDPGETKVSELHVVLDVEEDVCGLQVPVEDRGSAIAAPVALLQGQRQLRHHLDDELLIQISPAAF